MTISSSDALPARSPMPLIVHSTWRTPPWIAARLLATARPRSSWQCVLKTALVGVRHARRDLGEELADVVRRRVADRVGQVDRRGAVGDRRFDDAAQEIAIAPRRILRRKLHIVGEAAGRGATPSIDRLEARLARDAQLALEVQIGGREERVDARPLGRLERARRLFDVLRPAPRQRRDDRAAALRARPGAPLRSRPATRSGSPASMMSTPSASSARAMRQLRRHVHREAGRLLAVAERGVEDDDACGIVAHAFSCSRRQG